MQRNLLKKRSYVYYNILIIELAIAFIFSGSAVSLCIASDYMFMLLILLNVCVLITILWKNRGHIILKKNADKFYYGSVLIICLISTFFNLNHFTYSVTGKCILSITVAILFALGFESSIDAMMAFVKIMKIFSIIGILAWLFFSIFNNIINYFPLINSLSNENVSYNTLFIYSQMVGSTRNGGAFWEPSIFAGYIVIAMIISQFYLKLSNINIIIFVIALLTTQSSGGILLLILFLIAYIWNRDFKILNNSIFLKVFSMVLIFGLILMWNTITQYLLSINYDMFSKIFNFSSHGSTLTRLESVKVDLNIWYTSPIVGVGVDNMEKLFLKLRDILATITGMAHTSTSTEYIAAFGIGGIWINLLWIKSILNKKGTLINKVCILSSIILILNESPQINFVWTYFVLFILIKSTQCKHHLKNYNIEQTAIK